MGPEEKRVVCPGELYRHFKGQMYQAIAVATHSETGEAMVVYQQLYGGFRVYVRPYDLFVSPVDKEKYPDATQEYRCERVRGSGGPGPEEEREAVGDDGEEAGVADNGPGPNPSLLRFLSAETPTERLASLKELASTASQSDLDSVYLILDMKREPGTIKEQVDAISRNLALQGRYDGARLR